MTTRLVLLEGQAACRPIAVPAGPRCASPLPPPPPEGLRPARSGAAERSPARAATRVFEQ